MAQIPGVHLETLMKPTLYSTQQLDHACAVAHMLNRGRLVICVPPALAPEPPEDA